MKYYRKTDPKEQGICVVAKSGEPLTDLIKRFKKKYSKSGLNKEARDKMFFVKPGDKKRMKKVAAERMRQREEEKKLKRVKKLRIVRNKKKGDINEKNSSSKRQSNSRSFKTGRIN